MKSYVCGILFLLCIGLVPSTTETVHDMNLEFCRWGYAYIKPGGVTVRPCTHMYCNPKTGLINLVKCPLLRCDSSDNVLRAPPDESKEFPDCCPSVYCATEPSNG